MKIGKDVRKFTSFRQADKMRNEERKNRLWEGHRGDYRDVYLLEDCLYL
jgi:hypothetical protein